MQNKKKILYFIQLPPPVHGQAKLSQWIYESELIDEVIQKELLQIRFAQDLSQLGKHSVKKVFQLIRLSFKLIRRILGFKPDFVFFTVSPRGGSFYRDLVFVSIIKLLRVKPIYHLHRVGMWERAQRHWWMKLLYRYTFNNSIILHGSKGLLKNEIEPLGLKNVRLFAVENGIPDIAYPAESQKNGSQDLYILFLSNLAISKGVLILLNAFAQNAIKYPQIKLHLVGGSKGQASDQLIQDFIREHSLEDRVIVHGPKYEQEKFKMLKRADIFIHPTLDDTFPVVVLEAMQYGKPIISTNVGAIPEMIDNNENGAIVPVGDAKALAEKLETYITDEELRIEMGLKAKQKFDANYTLKHYQTRVRNVFESL